MRLNKRNNTKKFNKIILVAIMFIGLGFAALSATLGIAGHAIIGNISFDVHFANVEVKEGSMEAKSPATISASDDTQINFSLHLTTPGQFYEFETDIINSGTLDAYLSSIELLGLDESTKKYLKVTYKYVNGSKIRINDLLKSGETERIKVKVDFLYDITLDDLPSEETSLDFTLTMTYTQDNGTGIERDKAEVVVDILGQEMIAYMDNVASEYVESKKGINFSSGASDTNGKGFYLRAGTENDEYPIYYYRGDIDNNNVLFANRCWKIVRTTEKGGTKILYNGVPNENGICNNTGIASELGKSPFNKNSSSSKPSLSKSGYMYNGEYPVLEKSVSGYVGGKLILTHGSLKVSKDDNYYISKEYTWDGSKYNLVNPQKIGSYQDVYKDMKGYVTCASATSTSCTKLEYLSGMYSGYYHYIPLENGRTAEEENIDLYFSSKYVKNDDGTFSLVNPITIKRIDWSDEKELLKGMYLCHEPSDTTCDELDVFLYKSNTHHYLPLETYKFGSSVTWDGNKYILSGDVVTYQTDEITQQNNLLNNYHYTCFNKENSCEEVFYIISSGYDQFRLYYTTLKNGVIDAYSEEMLPNSNDRNKIDSTIKAYIDEKLFEVDGGLKEYTTYLEDSPWCNERTISDIKGWNPNGGNGSSLYYKFSNSSSVDLICENEFDRFTVSSNSGNGKLKYPVGLITIPELNLGGASHSYNSSSYLYSGSDYWTMTPSLFTSTDVNMRLVFSSNALPNSSFGVRPAVVLKKSIVATGGDGSSEHPYVVE